MPSLKELQESFSSAVYEGTNEPLLNDIKQSHIENIERIKIYQNNVLITLHDTLKNRYGAIYQLVGEDFFKHITNEYIKANKSNSGNLDDYGHNFAEFISAIPQLESYPYLKDVAKLEWALHNAYFAPNSPAINKEALSEIPPESLDKIKFKIHPSRHLIASQYPIDKIWEISQENYDGSVDIDVNSGEANILVVRPEYKINTIKIGKDEFKFLTSIANGDSLENAYEAAGAVNEDFDIGAALQKFVLNGTFVDFYFDK